MVGSPKLNSIPVVFKQLRSLHKATRIVAAGISLYAKCFKVLQPIKGVDILVHEKKANQLEKQEADKRLIKVCSLHVVIAVRIN